MSSETIHTCRATRRAAAAIRGNQRQLGVIKAIHTCRATRRAAALAWAPLRRSLGNISSLRHASGLT